MANGAVGLKTGSRRKKPIRGPRLMQYKPGGSFWLMGTYLGVRLRKSTFTNTRSIAEEEMSLRLAEVKVSYQGRGKPRKATYGETHEKRFKNGTHSVESVRDAEAWLALIGPGTLCEDVDWEMVEGLAERKLRPGYKESSLKRWIVPVKATLVYAHEHFGLRRGCPAPKFPTLKDGKPREIYLEPKYCFAMHRWLVRQDHQLVADVFCIGLGEGPRRGELFAMSFQFVDMEREIITLRDTKSSGPDEKRDRTISDPRPWTMEILRAIRGRRRASSNTVFLRADGTAHAKENSFGSYMNGYLRKAAEAAGVPDWEDVTLHVLRHTAATNHYLLTGDMHEVELRFDWNGSESVRRYIKNQASKKLAPEVAELYGLTGIWHNPHALVRFENRNTLISLSKVGLLGSI